MRATLVNVAGSYGQDSNGELTYTRAQLTPRFENGFLIMEKVLGGDGCTPVTVDGVTLCKEVDETITLQCKYSLADQTVDDSFQVTGQDTATTAEGTGTLDYTITVEDNKKIGETVKFTISPVNDNLVYATVKKCDVTRNGQALTIIGHGQEHCTNPVVNAAAETSFFTSQGDIEGTWTAFKWSTTQENNVEAQGLSCTIGLSETASTDPVDPCALAN